MSAKAEDMTEAQRKEARVMPEASRNMVPLTPPVVVNRATLSMPRVRPGAPAAELIQAALRSAVARVQAADPEARRGEPEGIHRLRTSTRRLRSELRAVEGLVDCCWHQRLEGELKWLTGLLGSVRDLDILRQRLHEAVHELLSSSNGCEPGQDETLRPLFQAIDDRHATNARALREALQADRYRADCDDSRKLGRAPRAERRSLGAVSNRAAAAGRRRLAPAQEASTRARRI